ncbi:hypothetical protein ES332_D07G105300v1 [Gossypium tomentosum]|uniref:Uncharacterized protein n=1 Tax=Gossypium tomentosum TaxID=34277 RepID=A0A5D2K649_GOSTO|nr:hypothetical protein ES332_D07G105300v1 [Gossypium tomentosum]
MSTESGHQVFVASCCRYHTRTWHGSARRMEATVAAAGESGAGGCCCGARARVECLGFLAFGLDQLGQGIGLNGLGILG